MKPFEMPIDHQHYPVGLIIQDAFIVLTPVILTLIGLLWFFWNELGPDPWGLAK